MKRLALVSALGLAVAGLFAASAASAATATAPLTVSAEISNACSVVASPIDLGDQTLGSPIDSNQFPGMTSITVICNQGTAWSLDADSGLNYGVASGDPKAADNAATWDGSTSRAMANAGGTALLSYNLYTDDTYSTVFGDTGSADNPLTGVGTGDWQQLPISIEVTQIGLTPTGSYTDTVGLTLTY